MTVGERSRSAATYGSKDTQSCVMEALLDREPDLKATNVGQTLWRIYVVTTAKAGSFQIRTSFGDGRDCGSPVSTKALTRMRSCELSTKGFSSLLASGRRAPALAKTGSADLVAPATNPPIARVDRGDRHWRRCRCRCLPPTPTSERSASGGHLRRLSEHPRAPVGARGDAAPRGSGYAVSGCEGG